MNFIAFLYILLSPFLFPESILHITSHEVSKAILLGTQCICAAKFQACTFPTTCLLHCIPMSPGPLGSSVWYLSSCHHLPFTYFLMPSLVAQLVKNLPAMQETWVRSLVGKILWRRERLPTPVFWPAEFHGIYSSWGRKKLDMTKWLSLLSDDVFWSPASVSSFLMISVFNPSHSLDS